MELLDVLATLPGNEQTDRNLVWLFVKGALTPDGAAWHVEGTLLTNAVATFRLQSPNYDGRVDLALSAEHPSQGGRLQLHLYAIADATRPFTWAKGARDRTAVPLKSREAIPGILRLAPLLWQLVDALIALGFPDNETRTLVHEDIRDLIALAYAEQRVREERRKELPTAGPFLLLSPDDRALIHAPEGVARRPFPIWDWPRALQGAARGLSVSFHLFGLDDVRVVVSFHRWGNLLSPRAVLERGRIGRVSLPGRRVIALTDLWGGRRAAIARWLGIGDPALGALERGALEEAEALAALSLVSQI